MGYLHTNDECYGRNEDGDAWGPVWLEEWSSVAVCVKPDVFEEPVNEVRVQI